MSVVWMGQCRAAGGGGAGASSVDRHCRDGSGVWVRLWSQASEPAELRARESISDAVIHSGNVLQQNSEIIRRRHVKQGPNKAHESLVLGGARVPYVYHSLVVTVDEESFACPVGTPCCCCHQDGIELSPLDITPSLR